MSALATDHTRPAETTPLEHGKPTCNRSPLRYWRLFVLKVPLPDVVAMQFRQPRLEGTGEIKLRRLFKEALRMRPSRIIVGEVRQEESLDLHIALNSRSPAPVLRPW